MPTGKPQMVEVMCRVCGKPVYLEAVLTGDATLDAACMRATRAIVHDECHETVLRNKRELEANELLHQQASKWTFLCPALYQTSEAWLLTSAAKRKVNELCIKAALDWNDQEGRSLILFGAKSGTGKTTAAWLIVKRAFHRGAFVVSLTHGELSRRATQLARDGTAADSKWARTVRNCDLLLIDDFGKARLKTMDGESKAAEQFVFEIVDHRATHAKPVVITSNHNREGIRGLMSEALSEPFVRRLNDYYTKINFDV